MERQMWLIYAVAAGLCWGTYVPLVQQGIGGLARNSFASFLCVGVAYFLIAVLFPLAVFFTGAAPAPQWNVYGITFATIAGAAGAFGALFVIFANRAVPQGEDYRMYIAPVIFALAPVLNTVISLFWHPDPVRHEAFHFGLKTLPGWKFYVGILLTGAGAALVLLSKEEAERAGKANPVTGIPVEKKGTTP
jgi:drug/metabolite transporter (DMT)-like permease